LFLAIFSPLAFGQGNRGSINGTVTDTSGAVLAGVKVTAKSPALIGEEIQVTGEQGLYRFPSLPIGEYRLTYELGGFGTVIREKVVVQVGFSDEINLTLSPASQSQSVLVTAETPLVDTENSNVQNNITQTQLGNLATSRDIWSVMGVTPGMTVKSNLDVGGTAAGTQPTYVSYGYGSGPLGFDQVRTQLDGVNTTEGRNGAGFYWDYGSLAEFQVTTAGNDASMPVPGTFINAVIKQGGNAIHGQVYYDYENPNFQGTNINQKQLMQGAGTGTRIVRYMDPNGDIGGPVIKDRLWYYLSLREQRLGNTVAGFPVGSTTPGNYYTYLQNITYKVSGQINKNHRLSQYAQWGRKNQPSRNAANNYYTDAVYNQNSFSWASSLQYDGIITPKFFITGRFAVWGYNWMNTAYAGTDGKVDLRQYEVQTTDVKGGYPPYRYNRRRNQYEPTGSYFLDNFLGANHQLKFGFIYEHEYYGNEQYGPLGQVYLWYNSPTGSPDFTTPYRISIENGPTVGKDYMNHGGSYIQDQIRIKKRFTLNVGVRWDYYRAYEPSETVRNDALFRGFYYAGQALPNGYSIPASYPNYQIPGRQVLRYPFALAPRIGLAIDLTGKGKTVLKTNWGRFNSNPAPDFGSNNVNSLQYIGGAAAGVPTSGTAFTFNWNNPNNLPFNINQIGSYVSGSSPAGVTVAPHIKIPVMDDASIFLDHQLSSTLSIRGGFVYRYMHHDWQKVDIARTYGLYTQPVSVVDPGPDGVKGTSDDKNVTVYDIPNSTALPVSQFQMQTPNGNNEQYTNFEVSANKRMSSKWMMVGSFNWTGQHYLQNGVPTNPLMAYNNYVKDSYWTSHISGTYEGPWGIMISPILRAQQGQPIDRTYTVTGLHSGSYALVVDRFGAWHYDNLYVFDTRLEKRFRIKERYSVAAVFDAYNIFNSNGVITYTVSTGTKSVTTPKGASFTGVPTFGAPITILGPRVFRLGVKFNF
jgi:hypothetical protein